MGVVWPFIIDQRLRHLNPHMFPCHRSHSWISGGDHFLVKNPYVLAFSIIENGHSWLFSTKMGVVWPLIIDQRLIHVTPYMFPCHRSHSFISGGDHFLVKNPNVLAFGTIENGRSWLFLTKMGVVWPLILARGSYTTLHKCFLAIDHILGFMVETISWSKIRRC
jgi:lipoprotein signal peptidase